MKKLLLSLIIALPNLAVTQKALANDPLFYEQWHLSNDGRPVQVDITDIKSKMRPGVKGADIGLAAVRSQLRSKKMSQVVVAVFDMGVDYDHPDLKDNILKNDAECEQGRLPLGIAKEDKDKNGYKGDCLGLDLTVKTEGKRNRPDDSVGHGTHVASIIAATSGNGIGIEGLGNQIKILPVKVIRNDRDGQSIGKYSELVAEGLRYAVSRGAHIINMSFGWPIALDSEKVREAFEYAQSKGVLIVAAAGNNGHGTPVYPCAYEGVVCVGSTRNDDKASLFTNYGAHVDILAPGERMLGAIPEQLTPKFYSIQGYDLKSGTSQAAPLVAGSLAVLKSANPKSSWTELLGRLYQSANAVIDDELFFNGGRIQLDKALNLNSNTLVKFEFKDTALVEVKNNGQFELPIHIKNYSGSKQARKIEVLSLTPGVTLSSQQNLNLEAGSNKKLVISGSVSQLDKDSQLKFQVKISGQKSSLQFAEVQLTRPLMEVTKNNVLALSNSNKLPEVSTMPDIKNELAGDYYYHITKKTSDSQLELSLWKRQAKSIDFMASVKLDEMQEHASIFSGDFNLDGKKDILLIGRSGEASSPDIHFCYFEDTLKPLLKSGPCITKKKTTEFAYQSLMFAYGVTKNMRWQQQIINNQSLLTPVFVSPGFMPAADQDGKTRRNPEVKKHIYYFNLQNSNSGLEFIVRAYDSSAWMNNMVEKYQLYYYENLEVISVISQPTAKQSAYLFKMGQLENTKMLLVELRGNQLVETLLNWPNFVYKYNSLTTWDMSDLAYKTSSALGVIASNRAHLLTMGSYPQLNITSQQTLDLPDVSETILGLLLSSYDNGSYKTVLEAGQRLYGFIGTKSRQAVVERRLSRTTFLNNVFNQVTLPVIDSKQQSAIYVDNFNVNMRNTFVWTLDEKQGFVAQLKNNISVPKNCRPMTPVRWSLSESHKMSFLCRSANQGLEIRWHSL